MTEMSEVKSLRLEQPVVVRKVPMTAQGCNMLRAIRDYQVAEYAARGDDVEIPFPVVIHLMMREFCAMKNITVH